MWFLKPAGRYEFHQASETEIRDGVGHEDARHVPIDEDGYWVDPATGDTWKWDKYHPIAEARWQATLKERDREFRERNRNPAPAPRGPRGPGIDFQGPSGWG